MPKVGKSSSEAKRCASGDGVVSKNTKANNGARAREATTLAFAHRTPTQLHASTYALKRG